MAYRLLDRTGDSGCTYDSTPTPDEIDLSGTDVDNLRSFADAITDGDLADGDVTTVAIFDDSGNWKTCHVTLVTGTPNVFQIDEVIASEGTIADDATVTTYAVVSQDSLKHLLLTETATVTTADVSPVPGKSYELTVSGLTADRNFILPSASAGDKIEVSLVTDAPADYELIVKGDTGVGVLISGNLHTAAEATRLFQRGERLVFKYGSDSVWYVNYDGRIPCMSTTGATFTHTSSGSFLTLDWASLIVNDDRGGLVDTANDRWLIRRPGIYDVTGQIRPSAAANATTWAVKIQKNETDVSNRSHGYQIPGASSVQAVRSSVQVNMVNGDRFRIQAQQNDSASESVPWYFHLKEILD